MTDESNVNPPEDGNKKAPDLTCSHCGRDMNRRPWETCSNGGSCESITERNERLAASPVVQPAGQKATLPANYDEDADLDRVEKKYSPMIRTGLLQVIAERERQLAAALAQVAQLTKNHDTYKGEVLNAVFAMGIAPEGPGNSWVNKRAEELAAQVEEMKQHLESVYEAVQHPLTSSKPLAAVIHERMGELALFKQQEPRWISVESELPPVGELVLIHHKGDVPYLTGQWNGTQWTDSEGSPMSSSWCYGWQPIAAPTALLKQNEQSGQPGE